MSSADSDPDSDATLHSAHRSEWILKLTTSSLPLHSDSLHVVIFKESPQLHFVVQDLHIVAKTQEKVSWIWIPDEEPADKSIMVGVWSGCGNEDLQESENWMADEIWTLEVNCFADLCFCRIVLLFRRWCCLWYLPSLRPSAAEAGRYLYPAKCWLQTHTVGLAKSSVS